jgi:hypothetical protein
MKSPREFYLNPLVIKAKEDNQRDEMESQPREMPGSLIDVIGTSSYFCFEDRVMKKIK